MGRFFQVCASFKKDFISNFCKGIWRLNSNGLFYAIRKKKKTFPVLFAKRKMHLVSSEPSGIPADFKLEHWQILYQVI